MMEIIELRIADYGLRIVESWHKKRTRFVLNHFGINPQSVIRNP